MSVLPEFNLFGELSPPPPAPRPSYAPVYQAYERAGGKLDRFARAALGQQARKCVKDGHTMEKVSSAAGKLAREGSYPAYLGRTVREMPEPCVNGVARARLTQQQLQRCPCSSCAQWHTLRVTTPLEV
ncbi:MAG: hypothetical protein M3R04_06540 [bacterium]|nr:hypothetical protein [bacterium]